MKRGVLSAVVAPRMHCEVPGVFGPVVFLKCFFRPPLGIVIPCAYREVAKMTPVKNHWWPQGTGLEASGSDTLQKAIGRWGEGVVGFFR